MKSGEPGLIDQTLPSCRSALQAASDQPGMCASILIAAIPDQRKVAIHDPARSHDHDGGVSPHMFDRVIQDNVALLKPAMRSEWAGLHGKDPLWMNAEA